MNNFIIFTLILSLNIIFLCIGYILGKISNLNTFQTNNNSSFFSQQNNKKNDTNIKASTISIDDTKVVVAIKTDGLEKKYNNLGKTTTSSENISESVNKLKQLKS